MLSVVVVVDVDDDVVFLTGYIITPQIYTVSAFRVESVTLCRPQNKSAAQKKKFMGNIFHSFS